MRSPQTGIEGLAKAGILTCVPTALHLMDFARWQALEDPVGHLDRLHGDQQSLALTLPAFDRDTDWQEVRDQIGPAYDHPAFGLHLDAATALSDRRRPALYRYVDASKLNLCTLADLLSDIDGAICLPGLGSLNLIGLVHLLARGGYLGPWLVNPGKDMPRAQAESALLNILDEAAENTPPLAHSLPTLPSKALGKGIEFIEFAVDIHSQRSLETQLRTLGFRRERQHRSKPVTLWRQGAINLVLNQAPGAARGLPEGRDPFVCDMGLKVGDALATVERSRAMGATPFQEEEAAAGLSEVSIPAIVEDSGSMVHFLDEASETHRVWDIDFVPLAEPWTGQPAGLRRIDHVAQTFGAAEMQRWTLFYLSTFVMQARSPFDVSDPAGHVSSRALETPEGEIRLTLNGTDNAKTLAGQFIERGPKTSVQHIAFATDDIFETSALIEAAGFERLVIEPEYYDSLGRQFDLAESQIAKLKKGHILYSEDASGHFYQIYSKPLRGGLFFEIVQRCHGYHGYGAANASVRLRAQSRHPQIRERYE